MASTRKIYCIGESLLDIVFSDNGAVWACPGGSMLNVAVSCARAGLDVALITEYGNDIVGNKINDFLLAEGVDVRYVYKYTGGQTALAIAELDKEAKATYQFYSRTSNEHLQIENPDFTSQDIVVFGSIAALSSQLSDRIYDVICSADKAGAMVIYDPNIRLSKLNNEPWKERFDRNIHLADLVKASVEDLNAIYGDEETGDLCAALLEKGASCVVATHGAGLIEVYSGEFASVYEVPTITPVSTIGAGDAFNAGLVKGIVDAGIMKTDVSLLNTNPRLLSGLMHVAMTFAKEVCLSNENFINKNS